MKLWQQPLRSRKGQQQVGSCGPSTLPPCQAVACPSPFAMSANSNLRLRNFVRINLAPLACDTVNLTHEMCFCCSCSSQHTLDIRQPGFPTTSHHPGRLQRLRQAPVSASSLRLACLVSSPAPPGCLQRDIPSFNQPTACAALSHMRALPGPGRLCTVHLNAL